MVAERWSAAPESLSDESENVEEMKSAAPAAIDAAGDVAGCVAGWNGDETKIEAEVLVQQIAGVTDAIEDKDQLSKTDARVECVVEEIIDDHVLRVTDNAVESVKCSAQERVQSYTVEQSVDVPVTLRCAFTMEDSDELIPEWLSFVKGVVDSEDPPLNIYRETLPENKILRVIKKHVTKCLEMLAEIAELEDDYKKFYELYGKCRNDEDSTVGVKIAELLTFNTTKPGDEQNNLVEYVDRIKEGQNDVYHIASENTAVVSSSPFEENWHEEGLEEPHVADPMDEYAVYQFKESDGTKLNPTTKEGLNLGDDDEKQTPEELKVKLKSSTKLMKDVLGDKVEMVIASDRIVDSPCVLTTSEYGWSAKIERIMNAQALRDNSMTSDRVSKKTMEVNPTHPIVTELETRTSTDKSDKTVKDSISLLTSGFNLDGPTQFAGRVGTQQRDSSQAVASNNCKHQQPQVARQPTRQERRKGGTERGRREQEEKGREERKSVRKGQRGRGQGGRKKEEDREGEEGGGEQVKKDVTDWTVVTRNRRQRKMVQIFVRVNGSKATPMDVNLADDKVEDVLRRIQNDEDAYVTMHGRVLKRGEKLKSCEVTDGCTIQVTSRSRGGEDTRTRKA